MESQQFKSLNMKRGQIKSRLTRLSNFFQGRSFGEEVHALKVRLDKFESAWDDFDQVQSEIEILTNNNSDQLREREEFENEYSLIVGEIKKFIESGQHKEPQNIARSTRIRLPVLELPKFSGLYEEWLSFRDRFVSSINNDNSLSDIDKFQYLQSCVRGEAAETIKSISITAANYKTAWEKLQARYEDTRLLVQSHVNALFNLPKITKNSASSIKKVLDIVDTNLACLNSLKVKTENWDLIIIYFVVTKFDVEMLQDWEAFKTDGLPTLDNFRSFLTNKYKSLESIEFNKSRLSSTSNPNQFLKYQNKHFGSNYHKKEKSHSVSNVAAYQPFCALCKSNHFLYRCPDLLKIVPESRLNKIRELNLCANCFKTNHQTFNCQSSARCKTCNKKHHTLLHINKTDRDIPTEVITSPPLINSNEVQPQPSTSALTSIRNYSQVLLSTAVIHAFDSNNCIHECRVLLDVGSQSNFITEEMVKKLKLNTSYNDFGTIIGITQNPIHINKSVVVKIKSRINMYSTELKCLVLAKITEKIPNITFSSEILNIPSNISLADPKFNLSQPIDMLIGAELFYELLNIGQITLGKNKPHLQKTNFGWVLGGTIYNPGKHKDNKISCLSIESLDSKLTKFWEIEECQNSTKVLSPSELECENHFIQTHYRNKAGRFVVRLPFKTDVKELGLSKDIALKRFYLLEKKLAKNPELKNEYAAFMREYLKLGHMEHIKSIDSPEPDASMCYYLPHHAVIKESSLTTKLRVVFDGSARTTSGESLNNNLLVGPTIQDELFSILLRFRSHRYVLSADITKMYRQIQVNPLDRDFQRILWRENTTEEIETYRLTTVTYGTSSAPFLAIRSLRQLAYDEQVDYPLAHKIINRDFYVDDLLTGANTVEGLSKIRDELITVLLRGGFELRKWASNTTQLLPDILPQTSTIIDIDKNVHTKTLGLHWNCKLDSFKYSVNILPAPRVTKRIILSTIAQIFDPLGLIGPILIKSKIIMQRLWSLKSNWDESIPSELHTMWLQYIHELPILNMIEIQRQIACDNPIIFEIHGFCDASILAYGACIYLKTINSKDETSVQLLCAKSRVAPLKTTTVPRLELCGALLLSRLLSKVISSLSHMSFDIYLWSDSTIVLSWLNTCPSELKTFVANRVSEIQNASKSSLWRHVPTEHNPADIISRGLSPSQLLESKLWWHGPEFLKQSVQFYPDFKHNPLNEIPEKRHVSCLIATVQTNPLLNKYSSFSKLQRVIAHCLRFIYNCRSASKKLKGHLSCNELNNATNRILKFVQLETFSKEINQLKEKRQVSSESKMLTLNVFLDENELIRVGGRLNNASIPYNRKHPILLPKNHFVTELLIMQEHIRHLHSGPQLTLACLRNTYWIISGRNVIRKVLHKCITCFRTKPIISQQLMGDLPRARIVPARPFLHCGVDYAGPILIKDGFGRSKKTIKSYIALFVCLATKAIHLELVCDLSSDTFLSALKRFISRRGNVSDMYSDNGTNFVGANNELQKLKELFESDNFKSNIINTLATKNINWHFIPPGAPNFGGLWEAGVKSVKFHLRRIVGNTMLNYDQLYTLLTQIEACLNSRPLIPLSNDPNDLSALTPGHFLIGDSLTAPVEPDLTCIKENRLSKWQRIQQLLQHFWKRWSLEYLGNLQSRSKSSSNSNPDLKNGTIVLIKDDNLPPMHWRLGRIVEVHPGKDSKVRVVSVKTQLGVIKRPITKVCVLPITDNVKNSL